MLEDVDFLEDKKKIVEMAMKIFADEGLMTIKSLSSKQNDLIDNVRALVDPLIEKYNAEGKYYIKSFKVEPQKNGFYVFLNKIFFVSGHHPTYKVTHLRSKEIEKINDYFSKLIYGNNDFSDIIILVSRRYYIG